MDLGSAFAGIGGWIGRWVTSIAFWMIVSLAMGLTIILALWMKKQRGFDKLVLEIFDLGDGRCDFKLTKGGWFKHRFTMAGLWDYGNEKLFRLKDMTPVYDISHNDYRLFNGKPCVVVLRNPYDPKFVVPISKLYLDKKTKSGLAEIAPVDLRNAATHAIEEVDIEMQTKWEKWAPLVVGILLAFILIFSILLIAQYGKHNIEVTSETLRYAIDKIGNPNYQVPASALPSSAP